ncbi:hypothetical protein Q2100_10135 [Mycolicibacterium sp. KC 300]|uniref:HTH-type transcriptional repressor KstR2 C-terminal domain-containing protein n=1 Tax=Mycolicibacterium arseniciresistens TaxID=3062257 RepID=A0ABT8UGX0_9MYCO|nr:hypothetical protein [Mycolicibacterium arseniciresistens]
MATRRPGQDGGPRISAARPESDNARRRAERRAAFRSDLDSRLVLLGILGMHNWIHRWYAPGGRNTLAQIGDTFAELVLSGVRTWRRFRRQLDR